MVEQNISSCVWSLDWIFVSAPEMAPNFSRGVKSRKQDYVSRVLLLAGKQLRRTEEREPSEQTRCLGYFLIHLSTPICPRQ